MLTAAIIYEILAFLLGFIWPISILGKANCLVRITSAAWATLLFVGLNN